MSTVFQPKRKHDISGYQHDEAPVQIQQLEVYWMQNVLKDTFIYYSRRNKQQ